ncbi:MAG TPA: hypothetical protein ENI23_09675, partial [bacterium]|nr:hypothetical protein [bacterium]
MKKKKFLPETHPHLCAEWDFEKNSKLWLESVTHGSEKKVWWICSKKECSHSWKTLIFNRTGKKPSGC